MDDSNFIPRHEFEQTVKALEARLRLVIIISVFAADAVVSFATPVAAAAVAGGGIGVLLAVKLLGVWHMNH